MSEEEAGLLQENTDTAMQELTTNPLAQSRLQRVNTLSSITEAGSTISVVSPLNSNRLTVVDHNDVNGNQQDDQKEMILVEPNAKNNNSNDSNEIDAKCEENEDNDKSNNNLIDVVKLYVCKFIYMCFKSTFMLESDFIVRLCSQTT